MSNQLTGLTPRYGANSDGYDMVAPSGVGGEACMDIATSMADKSSYVQPKPQTPNAKCQMPNPQPQIPNPKSETLPTAILPIGCRVQGAGFKV